jgi:type II secretion system protein G
MNKKGFTLIELLIVVAIIGIVAAIAIPNLLIAMQKGKQKATMGDMKSIGTAVESYITDWSFAPQANILALITPTWFSPFYIKVMPRNDGWGYAFVYSSEANTDVYSIRSNGRIGNNDATTDLYDVLSLADFNKDIVYSNGIFTVGPKVKK